MSLAFRFSDRIKRRSYRTRGPQTEPLLQSSHRPLRSRYRIWLSILFISFSLLGSASTAPIASGAAPRPLDAAALNTEPADLADLDQNQRLIVHADQRLHRIPDEIYGMSFADPALLEELALPLNRWGGNATTRYNWRLDVSNRASDWYFENIPNDVDDENLLPVGSGADRWVAANKAARSQSMLTLPLIGWTPKSRERDCGFRVSKYGPQRDTDPWAPDCGDGLLPNNDPITGNDPTDTSLAIDPSFGADWVEHLHGQFGLAMNGGVRYYNLDNEPMLWSHTHRDVHPEPVGYDELLERTIRHATAVKDVDAAAGLLGPSLWGWTAYFYSALDQAGGGNWWNDRPDRRAHGDVPLVPWYLKQLADHEAQHGQRLLDFLDLHFYPQAAGVALSPAGNDETQDRRLRSVSALYDPGYVDESWIAEPVQLIPRMHDWIQNNYPGTRLAISEYNWGGLEHINGALAQAEVLGIFGREGLDLAALWSPPEPEEPGAYAFRMFLNTTGDRRWPGGQQGRFGQTALALDIPASSDDHLRAFGAIRDDGYLTLVLIQRSTSERSLTVEAQGFAANRRYHVDVSTYAAATIDRIEKTTLPLPAGEDDPLEIDLSLPAQSITLVEIPPSAPPGITPFPTAPEPTATSAPSVTQTRTTPTASPVTGTPTGAPTESPGIFLPILFRKG